MTARLAGLVSRAEYGLAHVTRASHPLTRLLEYKILPNLLARTHQDNLFGTCKAVIVRNDRGLFLVLLDKSRPPPPAGLFTSLIKPGRVASALGATGMLAFGAVLRGAKSCVAQMAGAVDTHTDRLVDAKSMTLG